MQVAKILLIDSDLHFLGALQDGLGPRFRTKAVGSFELALEILAYMSFDAIVMELVLGQQLGLNLLKALNQRNYRPPHPCDDQSCHQRAGD